LINVVAPPIANRLALGLAMLGVYLLAPACNDFGEEPTLPISVINVTVRNTNTFQYPTVGGDEEGTRISVQARHYRVSQIRRNASTNWVALYIYQPEADYVGSDYTELEVFTNPTGRPENKRVSKVGLSFKVTN
jgi:hypothetical protein